MNELRNACLWKVMGGISQPREVKQVVQGHRASQQQSRGGVLAPVSVPASLTNLPATWGRSSLFLATVLPLLAPRITVDSDVQATHFLSFWEPGQRPRARPRPCPSQQPGHLASSPGEWESRFITPPFPPGPSRWSSCWVVWCPLGSEGCLGITTHPCLRGWTVVWGHRRPFSGSQFFSSQMGALGGWLSLRFLGTICSSPASLWLGAGGARKGIRAAFQAPRRVGNESARK